MSNYWSFACTDHTPNLHSEEFTQHTEDTYFWRGVELAKSRPLSAEDTPRNQGDAAEQYYDRNSWSFLLQHPNCALVLSSQTGERRPLDAPDVPNWD